jgi:hypothetical protein
MIREEKKKEREEERRQMEMDQDKLDREEAQKVIITSNELDNYL